MSKNVKRVSYVAAAVLVITAACFLAQDLGDHRAKAALAGLGTAGRAGASGETDLTGWDVSVKGISLEGGLLTCSGGKDVYLLLDGAEIYLQQPGDGKETPLKSSGAVLRQILSQQGEQVLHLWLTDSGKVEKIAACGKHA